MTADNPTGRIIAQGCALVRVIGALGAIEPTSPFERTAPFSTLPLPVLHQPACCGRLWRWPPDCSGRGGGKCG